MQNIIANQILRGREKGKKGMRRVGILTEIFREYHSPNKRNCRSLKASLRLVVAGHNVTTK